MRSICKKDTSSSVFILFTLSKSNFYYRVPILFLQKCWQEVILKYMYEENSPWVVTYLIHMTSGVE